MKNISIALIVSLSLAVTACGGSRTVKKSVPPATPSQQQTEAPKTESTTVPKRGGYYLDDGPGENPPADIDSIPDAVPRKEVLLERSNKPYSALGKEYTPMTAFQPFKQRGVASWYGKRYHSNRTSSGEVYDMYSMTAAHTTLPIPSYIRVTNPENGRSVVVKVNDRGPFRGGRILDLSYAAAYKLRLIEKGSGEVEIETIDTSALTNTTVVAKQTVNESPPANNKPVTEQTTGMSKEFATPSFFVQTGAFKTESNADNLIKKLQGLDMAGDAGVSSMLYNDGLYRVRLGPYSSRQEAAVVATEIRKKLGFYTLVVNQ